MATALNINRTVFFYRTALEVAIFIGTREKRRCSQNGCLENLQHSIDLRNHLHRCFFDGSFITA